MLQPKDSAAKTTQIRPRVVFFGSGPVAAESLELLIRWCDVEAVVTKPQPKHHREEFPVLTIARAHGLTILTASNRLEVDETMRNNSFASRVAILIDFGIIVSQAVIDSFELGIINSHFSLLPEWRGADPITFSILSGQAETGVSLMLLVAAMDEGPLLAQATYDIPEDCTTPELTEALIELSDRSLQHIVPLYLEGSTLPAPQEAVALPGHTVASYSRKLAKADGILDFTKSADQLEREVRAYAEWPRSRMQLAGKDVIVTKAHSIATSDSSNTTPGNTEISPETGVIMIHTADGCLCIDRLKPAGKNEMTAQAFLAGNKI